MHGTLDEKIPFNSSERLLDVCRARNIQVTGHPVMCGKHDLRDPQYDLKGFQDICSEILR